MEIQKFGDTGFLPDALPVYDCTLSELQMQLAHPHTRGFNLTENVKHITQMELGAFLHI